jgi:hypothetical protein
MPSPPTRRTRSSTEDRSLPIVPILIGVIVLGFVIGAGLSLSGRHDATVVAIASPSPARGDATFVPVTPAPTEKPTPQPTAAPASTPHAKSVRTAAPAPLEAATATPAKAAPVTLATPHRLAAAPGIDRDATANAPAAPPAPLEPRASAKPLEASPRTSDAPAIVAPAAAPSEATVPAPVATTLPEDSAFARLSAAVVRQYLESLKRGDQDAAFAVLASPPKSEADLAEFGIVDGRTRVARVDAHDAANSDALVSVQMDTPNGPYFGQYTVHKSDTGAAVIVAHSIVKP